MRATCTFRPVTFLLAATSALALLVSATSAVHAVQLGIGNLEVWLDGQDSSTMFSDTAGTVASTNLGAVRFWKDKSGLNHNAVADTAASPNRNDTELNGRGALQTTAAGGSLDITGINIVLPYTVFVVDEYTGGATGRVVQSESTNLLINKWSNQNSYYNNGPAFIDGNADGLQTAATNVPVIGTAIADNSVDRAFFHRNGFNVTAGTPPAGSNPGTLEIGPSAGPGGGEVSNAAVGEVIVYSRALTAAETTIVENYLSAKHSVNLNTGLGALDRYAGDTLANGDYDFGVFGIGQHSDTSIVTSGATDGLSISEVGGTLGSNEWVLAGHKTAINSINPDGSWARVWYVDKTETTGIDANLTFDFSDAGLTIPTLGPWTQIALLYSPTDPFAFGSLGIVGVVTGDQVSFSVPNSLLLDGYFTLQALTVPEPSTLSLLGLGAIGLAIRARQRKRARAMAGPCPRDRIVS